MEDLLDVARVPGCLRNEQFLASCAGLAAHPEVAQRLRRGMSLRKAIEDLLYNLELYGGQAGLSRPRVQAVAVLLNAAGFPYANRRWQQTDSWAERKAEVQRLLGEYSSDWWNGDHPGKDKTRPKKSGESDLYSAFLDALSYVQVPASTTRSVGATSDLSVAARSVWSDLAGTWAGVTVSGWLLKDNDAQEDGNAPCYMVIGGLAGESSVRWFYRHGTSVGVVADLFALGDRHRVVCVYEAFASDTAPGSPPSHRGTCLLEGDHGGLTGPYFTDKRTHGELRFTSRVPDWAVSFDDAAWLLRR